MKIKKEKPMMSVTAIIQGSQNHWSSRNSITRKFYSKFHEKPLHNFFEYIAQAA